MLALISPILSYLVGPAMPIIARIVLDYLDRKKASEERKRAWLNFIADLQSDGLVTVRLSDDFQRLLDQMKAETQKGAS